MRFHERETIPFTEPVAWNPRQMGCYGILNAQRQVIYVGKATCLRDRLTTHIRKQDAADARIHQYAPALVVGQVALTEAAMSALEKALILEYGPPCNLKVG